MAPVWLASDAVGKLAVSESGIVHYRTACCDSDVTGVPSGAACRACYRSVDDAMGMGWLVDDDASWQAYRARVRTYLREFTDDFVSGIWHRAATVTRRTVDDMARI